VLAARTESHLRGVAQDLDAVAVPTDVTAAAACDAAVARAVETYGRLDGVAHCVGSVLLKPAHLTSDEEWALTQALNLTSAFYMLRASVRAMQRSGGSIVLVSSAAAAAGLVNHEAIAAAKGGVAALALSAAATYASRGIRVNCVSPSLVRTPLTASVTQNELALKASLSLHPLGRIGEPDDVASAIAFLLDPAHNWITGQVLGVDGGLSRLRTVGGRIAASAGAEGGSSRSPA
jgi:NAD(P)-dependent dehydrogenase (short-subunit alcohol dehydrogenase family)